MGRRGEFQTANLDPLVIGHPDECWEWTGGKSVGYGTVQHLGKTAKVHRFVYELCKGPIPDGLIIDHTCENRGCANPQHLDAVSFGENIIRSESTLAGANARKSSCPKCGGEYSTYRGQRKNGSWAMKRRCVACEREPNRIFAREYQKRPEVIARRKAYKREWEQRRKSSG